MVVEPGYKLDLVGRMVPITRGPYKKLPLTKTAARLKAYLIKITNNSGTGWAAIDLQSIAFYLEVSVRSIQRAKNVLESNNGLVFRTITNEQDRQGHRLLVGNEERIQEDLHNKSVDGRQRNISARVGSKQPVVKPTIKVKPESDVEETTSSRAGDTTMPHSGNSLYQAPVATRDRLLPTDKPFFFNGEPPDKIHPPSKEKDYHQRRHTQQVDVEKRCPKRWAVPKPPSTNQRRLAHYIKQRCLDGIWDNCKVERPTNAGGIYNWALKWLMRGGSVNQMLKVFQTSLETQHRTATDVQLLLNRGADYRFNISSTITRADRTMTIHQLNGTLIVWTKDLIVSN